MPQNTLIPRAVFSLVALALTGGCDGAGQPNDSFDTTADASDASTGDLGTDTAASDDTTIGLDDAHLNELDSGPALPAWQFDQCANHCHRSGACLTAACPFGAFHSPNQFITLCERQCHQDVDVQRNAAALQDAGCKELNEQSCEHFLEVALRCDCSGGPVPIPPCVDEDVAAQVTDVHWRSDDVLDGFINGLVLAEDGSMTRSVQGSDECGRGTWSLWCDTSTRGTILLDGCLRSARFTFVLFQDQLQMLSQTQSPDEIAEYYFFTRAEATTAESMAAMCPAGDCQ